MTNSNLECHIAYLKTSLEASKRHVKLLESIMETQESTIATLRSFITDTLKETGDA